MDNILHVSSNWGIINCNGGESAHRLACRKPKTWTAKLKNIISWLGMVSSSKFAKKRPMRVSMLLLQRDDKGYNGREETTTLPSTCVRPPPLIQPAEYHRRSNGGHVALGAEGVQVGTRFAPTKRALPVMSSFHWMRSTNCRSRKWVLLADQEEFCAETEDRSHSRRIAGATRKGSPKRGSWGWPHRRWTK